jgi:isopentenyl-diphosphate delta-isomerase
MTESNSKEEVVLVDSEDQMIGTMEKMAAHQSGALHRAFSIFIINSNGQWLMQQRALDKYHSAGLWTNTCCSHPRPNETNFAAGTRRLDEEMGLHCELEPLFHFTYQCELPNGLIEHELDHVMVGFTDEHPIPNADEVAAFQYVDPEALAQSIQNHPDKYTVWFKLCFEKVKDQLMQRAQLKVNSKSQKQV